MNLQGIPLRIIQFISLIFYSTIIFCLFFPRNRFLEGSYYKECIVLGCFDILCFLTTIGQTIVRSLNFPVKTFYMVLILQKICKNGHQITMLSMNLTKFMVLRDPMEQTTEFTPKSSFTSIFFAKCLICAVLFSSHRFVWLIAFGWPDENYNYNTFWLDLVGDD
ncbi:unnamed protein product, partial [Mesorhabditis belari]|uniref:Uncharacterized protein n=1 Tax=Mesorhabditis belari TaxID=2138241 RepID=A0AAF3FA06_9BILA